MNLNLRLFRAYTFICGTLTDNFEKKKIQKTNDVRHFTVNFHYFMCVDNVAPASLHSHPLTNPCTATKLTNNWGVFDLQVRRGRLASLQRISTEQAKHTPAYKYIRLTRTYVAEYLQA